MKTTMRLFLAAVAILLASLLAAAQDAPAGNTQAKVTYNVSDLGVVEVLETWKGMKMETGVYPYFSATKESGIIPVRVENFGFSVNFATRSYLQSEEGKMYFVTPDFYYEASPLDVEITLHVPSNLSFVSATIEPATNEAGTITWTIPGAVHKMLIVEFTQTSPFAIPDSPTGPLWQVDPATLPELSAENIPQSPDEALKELETIIKMMQSDPKMDPDMVRVLRRSLSKFYYLFAVYGLVRDYVPEKKAEDAAPKI